MDNVVDLVTEVKELTDKAFLDAKKCDAGNHQAGIRVRKYMLDVIDTSKKVRKSILDLRG